MLLKIDFCDYDTCIALGELGFPLKRMKVKNFRDGKLTEDITVPVMLYEAQKWLREEKKFNVGASWDNDENNWYCYIIKIGFPDWSGTSVSHSCYSSYEEALSEGIKEAINLIK